MNNPGTRLSLPPDLRTRTVRGAVTVSCFPHDWTPERRDWCCIATAGPEGWQGDLQVYLPLVSTGHPPWFWLPGFWYGQGRSDPGPPYPSLGAHDPDRLRSPTWDFASDRMASPCALCHLDGWWTGFSWCPHFEHLGPSPLPRGQEPQLGCGLDWDDGRGALRVNLPANEGPFRHNRSPRNQATQLTLRLQPGAVIRFEFSIWEFPGDRQAGARVLEHLYQTLRSAHPPAEALPQELLAATAFHGLRAWHWNEADGNTVYTTPFDRNNEFNANNAGRTLQWHFESLGFVGGFPVACGLLSHAAGTGNAEARAMGLRLVRRFCSAAMTEWGLFHTSYHPVQARTLNGTFANTLPAELEPPAGQAGSGVYGGCWQKKPWLLHARTLADANLHLVRSLEYLENEADYPDVLQALRRNLEVVLANANGQGRLGQLYNAKTRAVETYAGAGGILWIPVFLESAPRFQEQEPGFASRLLAAAQAAGEAYAADLLSGEMGGAPEDTGLSPSSEDGYNAVMAYAALHRQWPSARWLDLWRHAADWTLGFRKCWNQIFPERNMLGQAGFRTTGGDQASPQNNCLHLYGLVCDRELRELSALTGKPWYAERAEDHARFAAQLLAVDDGQWNSQRGMCTEQVHTSDWSIFGSWDPGPDHAQKGLLMGMSHVWCVNMFLLAERARTSAQPAGTDTGKP